MWLICTFPSRQEILSPSDPSLGVWMVLTEHKRNSALVRNPGQVPWYASALFSCVFAIATEKLSQGWPTDPVMYEVWVSEQSLPSCVLIFTVQVDHIFKMSWCTHSCNSGTNVMGTTHKINISVKLSKEISCWKTAYISLDFGDAESLW